MDKYIEKLKKTVLHTLEDEKVKVVLFGSRARNDHRNTSDVDIGLIPYGKIDERKIIKLEEQIDDLNIPYKVELVNFSHVSEDFKKESLKGAVVWKD